MDRVELIKRRHGENAFKRYGTKGGNPMLRDKRLVRAYKQGRVRIVH